MESRSLGFGLPIALFVAMLLPATYRANQQVQTPHASAASSLQDSLTRPPQDASAATTALALIEAYAGKPLDQIPIGRRPLVRAMIVHVPDPVDAPPLDWAYDAALTSVRRAYEESKFVTDRFWLPWPEDAASRTRAARSREERPTDLRTSHAGVFLFRSLQRRSDGTPLDRDQLAVAFVVGETPARGIQKAAFRDALDQIGALADKSLLDDDARTLRIVGPYFTGSATSLRIELEAGLKPTRATQVHLLTGSATQSDIRREFAGLPQVQVEATINSDIDLRHVLVRAIRDRLRFSEEQVVLLQEASTPYGQYLSNDARTSSYLRQSGVPEPVISSESAMSGYLTIPFPMHIASLRDEAEQSAAAAPPVGTTGGSSFALSLREPGASVERPSSVSRLTPAAVSLVIDEIAHTLGTRHVRAVGIFATDVRDKIFLAREVRLRLPDVQLFTTESNLLYLWPEYNDYLRGMLVATTYPLFLEPREWSRTDRRQQLLAFPEEGAEGVFNAVLLQLNRYTTSLLDYTIPGDSTLRPVPPIWLLGVGRGRFVPLAIDSTYARTNFVAAMQDAPGVRQAANEPHVLLSGASTADKLRLLALVLLLGAAMVFAILRHYELALSRAEYDTVRRPSDPKPPEFEPLRRWVFNSSLYLHQEVYTFIRNLALGAGLVFSAFLLLKSSDWETAGRPPKADPLSSAVQSLVSWVPDIITVSAAIVVLISGWYIIRLLVASTPLGMRLVMTSWPNERRRVPREQDAVNDPVQRGDRWLWIAEVVCRFFVPVVALAFAFLVFETIRYAALPVAPQFNGLTTRLFYTRAIHLGSGLSPAVPILLGALGFVSWATWHLARIDLLKRPVALSVFADETGAPMPGAHGDAPMALDPMPALGERLHSRVRAIRNRLFFMNATRTSFGLFLVFGLLGIALALQFDETLESLTLPRLGSLPNPFDLILIFCVLASLGSLAWGVYRFWSIWLELQRLLDELAASPLLAAFERVPKRVSQLSQLSLRVGATWEAISNVATIQWGHLKAIHASADPSFAVLGADTRAAIDDLMSAGVQGNPFHTGETERREEITKVGSGMDARSRDEEYAGIEDRRTRTRRTTALRLRSLFLALNRYWQCEPEGPQVQSAVSAVTEAIKEGSYRSTSGNLRRMVSDPARLWLRAAEETVAVQVIGYIEWVLQHLRVLALFLLVAALLGTVLLSSYPFQPQSGVKMLFVGLLLVTVGSILTVGTQMNRNEVISRVTHSTPGRITWNASYVINILVFGVVPLLAYVGSGVRPIRDGVLGMLAPIIRVLTQH